MNVSKYVGPTFIIYAIVCINNIAIAQKVAANNAKASIIKYEKYIDVLNITPGAVITQNTNFLKDVEFSIECKQYVKNIFKLIGNYTGPQHAYWKHEISGILSYFINSDSIFFKVGKLIADHFMKKK